MIRWIYVRQPNPNVENLTLALFTSENSTGPWTNISYDAVIKQDDYWCRNRGNTESGDCLLVKFDDNGAVFAMARSVSLTGIQSQPSNIISLSEPNISTAVLLSILIILIFRKYCDKTRSNRTT